MNAKAKFPRAQTGENFHFCVILNERTNDWKYASFEGVEIVANP